MEFLGVLEGVVLEVALVVAGFLDRETMAQLLVAQVVFTVGAEAAVLGLLGCREPRLLPVTVGQGYLVTLLELGLFMVVVAVAVHMVIQQAVAPEVLAVVVLAAITILLMQLQGRQIRAVAVAAVQPQGQQAAPVS
jgi:hypothetical protein